MKKYYSTLSKDKKNKIKDIYKKEYKKTDLNLRLIRLNFYTVFGILFSIFLFIDAFKDENLNISSLIMAITLFIASIVFFIGKTKVKLDVLNKIALKNK